ncbi:hypothetical protein SAMN05216410_0066 [Sanguibacter gelidistatuariae]|uniref:Uncharacterized protein n=1 Tax=Sanguibacter gelidistatuariae TaxID=1814289 RepID=A0A1G6X3Y1_9MICO|nr:hypothetical protein [Sanguibacter gelidistatuariae]SDD72127.1 hypothetical protein SAMN05216410_0066 [Sanguibacter gelidistatuariae]
MATFVHHPGPAGITAPASPRRTARTTSPTSGSATAASAKTVTSRKVNAHTAADEPSKAASIVPVLLAFGALFAVAFGAAYFGRELIDVVGKLLGAN